jgi:murein DD-endopeptidase MepM/ murein hydrolase activator NlpD
MYKNKSFLIIPLLMLLFIWSCQNNQQTSSGVVNKEVVVKSQPRIAYGIVVDSLLVDTAIIKKNEFLSDILLKYNVSYATIDKLAKTTKQVFDVRKIRKGNRYVIIQTNDTLKKPLYFVYEINRVDYVVYHLADSVYATPGKKQLIIKEEAARGVILTSLWNAMVAAGIDPNLSNSLSEVYAWTIDFFGLQKKDRFKVIYDEAYIEGKPAYIDKIKAAMFHHEGEDLYAFYFEQNGQGDYFDEEGNSLERTFLKAPLKYTRISSRFSNSRYHPVLKIRRPHHGVDYAAPEGTPVHSVGDGIIIKKGYQKRGGGNYLKIKHNSTYTTTYMHLRGFAKGMKVGKHVKQGQLIGYVGHTGLATGPHLDFRYFKNGTAVNPLKVKSPPAKPVEEQYRPMFDSVVRHYTAILDTIK